jgi:hypothetical protein
MDEAADAQTKQDRDSAELCPPPNRDAESDHQGNKPCRHIAGTTIADIVDAEHQSQRQ